MQYSLNFSDTRFLSTQKLKLLSFLVDSVLIVFVFSLWIINEFEKDNERNDFNGT